MDQEPTWQELKTARRKAGVSLKAIGETSQEAERLERQGATTRPLAWHLEAYRRLGVL